MFGTQVKKVEEMTHEELLSYAQELEAYKNETVYRLTDEDIVSSMEGRLGFGEVQYIPEEAIQMAVSYAEDRLSIPYMDYVVSTLEAHFVRLTNPKVSYFDTTNDFDEIAPVYTVVDSDDELKILFNEVTLENIAQLSVEPDVVLTGDEKAEFINKYGEFLVKSEGVDDVSYLKRSHLADNY